MANALQSLLADIGLAVAPLRALDTTDRAVVFFRQLGYEIPVGAFGGALTPLSAAAKGLMDGIRTLSQAPDDQAVAVAIVDVLLKVKAAVDAMGQLQVQIQGAGGGGIPGIGDLPRRLTDFLLVDYFSSQRGELHGALHLLGLIDDLPAPPSGQPARAIHWNRLTQILNEPQAIARDVYRWDTDFDTGQFFTRLDALMRAASLPGGLYPQSESVRALLGNTTVGLQELRFPILQRGLTPETSAQFGITFSPAEAQGGKKKGVALLPYIMGAANFDFSVCDRGELVFESTADVRGVGIVVRPPFDAHGLSNLTTAFHAAITIREKQATAEEHILLGSPGGTRLAFQGLSVRWFADGTPDKLDLGLEGEVQAIRLAIKPGEGDGFLQQALSGVNVEAEAQLAIGLSLLSGFTIKGGAKLAIDVSVHKSVGPISIESLRFALSPATDRFNIDAGAVIKFELGPLEAVVENIGLRTGIKFQPGNLGPADLDVSFMPPNGVGLSLDAGGFKGGGFLRFDSERGEYAGALELDFNGLFSVKALGIINTKMPDGSPGFSLLILITAEFTPIQLSFGFTLNGVGGLFGLNRAIFVNALAEGIRTNAIKSILFPEDVVANATRIISDIKQFFPQQQDHFVVGPMAKLGWGTPSLITVELGLLLDLPNPMFAIVGVLKAVLPTEEAAILRLQVNFIGILDLDRGYLFFRADLFDSRLLIYSITGSMALVVSWGEQQTFALSVGGFHPDFRDVPAIPALPDGFRNMARIGISLLSDDNPRLKVESYFAVTSNTVQFGAKVELYAAAAGFNIYGFLGYDVLFQFDPFRFTARLYGGIALRHGSSVIAGISVSAQLSGPTPWDARGTASLTILFFDIDVDFHATWGDPPPAIESQTEDLLALLKREIADTRNWRADLPPENHLHVSLRAIEPPSGEAAPLVIHPAGVLTFSQRSMPLDAFPIEKFGARKPLNEHQFKLSDANAGGLPIPADFTGVREQFAVSQFSQLSDSDKLSRASFERLPSGFSLTGTSNVQATLPVTRLVDYELSYLRRKPLRVVFSGIVRLASRAYLRLVKSSAVRQSVLARQQVRPSMNAPGEVVLPAEQFTVATVTDLTAYAQAGGNPRSFATQAEAYQYHRDLMRRDPGLEGQLQVVSRYELAS